MAIFAVSSFSALAQPAAQPAAGEYRLGAEDVIEIQVWGREDLSGSVAINFDGAVQIPLIGSIRAAGRTTVELGRDLLSRFQLLEPSVAEVAVTVLEYKSLSVTLLGEVRKPGLYSFRELPDVWGAILAGGGPTEKAELGAVQIVRFSQEEAEERVLTVDLSAGLAAADLASLPSLRAKDSIVIPSAESAPIGGSNVHVLGAVNKPGTIRLTVARSVVEALSACGGPRVDADLGEVYLTRVTPQGVSAHKLDIKSYLQEAHPLDNYPLQSGDTITVPIKGSFWLSLSEGLNRFIPLLSLVVTYIALTN